ncbi:MAG: group I intron-associated PD-(D/E)XK endonuclease [bacterium]
MFTSNWKGQLAVSKAQVRAIELGYFPSVPVMDCRYDLVLEDKNFKLWRVQVKYANGKPANAIGSVIVKLAYETRQRRHVYTYSECEVDALVVYIPKIDKLCWFPCTAFVGKKILCVRIEPSLNNQKSKIYYAHDYFW